MKSPINQDKSNGLTAKRYGSVVSMPLAFSSLRIARLIHAETEASPSSFSAFCIPASNIGSTLSDICLLPLDFMVVDTCHSPSYPVFRCQVYDTRQAKTTKPDSALTLIGLLTTNVKRLTNMATNKFTFILAQGKQLVADLQEIRLVSVLAATEQEARQLIGHTDLVFSSKAPAKMGVRS